jgi:hypothetical protein
MQPMLKSFPHEESADQISACRGFLHVKFCGLSAIFFC